MEERFNHLKLGIFIFLALLTYFSFGLHHIGKFVTADEHLWIYDRIPRYWQAIANQNWIETYVHEKPGITLAIISGTGLLRYSNPSSYLYHNRASQAGTTRPIENMLTAFRIPILIFNGLFSLFFYWIIKKITDDEWIALWSFMLILLSPVLLGISQIVNADSLLWTFAFATILSFVAYLKKDEKKFAALTALFLGLSMLTKFTATILVPFLFIISILYYLEKLEKIPEKVDALAKKIFSSSLAYFLIVAGSMAVFSILLPASFFRLEGYLYDGTIGYSYLPLILLPISLIQLFFMGEYFWKKNRATIFILKQLKKTLPFCLKIIGALLAVIFLILIFNYSIGQDFLELEKVPFDARQDVSFRSASWMEKILLEFRPIIFSLSPIVVFFCLFLWIKSAFSGAKERFLILVFSLFILIYNIAVIQQDLLNTVRYNTLIYPAFSILAALGLRQAIPQNKNGERINFLATLLIFFLSFLSLWQIKPFYFNYSNFLLPKKYIVTDAWGYGGYEAAQYLNSLPEAEKKTVWSDYYGACEFLKGNCLVDYSVDQSAFPIDYFILTRRGKIRYWEKMKDKSFVRKTKDLINLQPYYEKTPSIWEAQIEGRPENYVRIVDASDAKD